MADEIKPVWTFCNRCHGNKYHSVVASYYYKDDVLWNEDGVYWTGSYEILRCGGCGNASYRTRTFCSEDQHHGSDEPYYKYEFYPPHESRPKPNWIGELPFEIIFVLDEVYNALHMGSRYLASVGARTALDMAIIDKIGDTGGFHKKLNDLVNQHYISVAERDILDALTEAGNASAHRGFAPDTKTLSSMMDILERVLEKFYVDEVRHEELMLKAAAIRRKVPPRTP